MNKKGFTLIEVIVATGILTISVFGVYKLIAENNKIIEKSNNTLNATLLFPVLENCIEYKSNHFSGYYAFGDNLNECMFSFTENSTNIDSIDYIIYANNESETNSGITWELSIYSDYTGTNTGNYIQKK